ncbi:Polyadenylation factor I complex, subunit FIP1 [Phaffia rhodozyma]|uniref:Polyadenylation factor I complex, subunit FIP1 n=1 Tax=Phaffia rhodozyma TaxID=264483 RepID=A0A0F7SS96_PHARH|nr:Polyadenylation factor I complex, subunit FIP1 [Phaffia rhodozyma]
MDPTASRTLDLRKAPSKMVTLGHGLGASKAVPPVARIPGDSLTDYTPSSRPTVTFAPLPPPSTQSTTLPSSLPSQSSAQPQQTAHLQPPLAAPQPTPNNPFAHLPPYLQTHMNAHLPPSHTASTDVPVDLNAPPFLPDGRSVYEIDLEQMERKDWRAPGADVSDWFNYGFDEFTWGLYVRRRREMGEMIESGSLMVRSFYTSVQFSSMILRKTASERTQSVC